MFTIEWYMTCNVIWMYVDIFAWLMAEHEEPVAISTEWCSDMGAWKKADDELLSWLLQVEAVKLDVLSCRCLPSSRGVRLLAQTSHARIHCVTVEGKTVIDLLPAHKLQLWPFSTDKWTASQLVRLRANIAICEACADPLCSTVCSLSYYFPFQ